MSALVTRKLQQAHQQLQSGDVQSAANLCEDVLRRAPRNPDALWLLGTTRLMTGRVKEATVLLERAVGAMPNHGAALEHLGLAYLLSSDYARAEDVLRRASRLPGAPSSVSMRLGLALLHLERHEEALEALTCAVRLDPVNADAHLALGRAYAATRDWPRALREFERVLSLVPGSADALYNVGVASAELGDLERSRAYLEQCVSRAPDAIEAKERLGSVCLALGRFSEAANYLADVVRANSTNVIALKALAEATFQCGAVEDAMRIAERVSVIEASDPGPYSLLAQIHHLRGELDRAVEVLERGRARTDSDALLGTLVHLLHRQCDWTRWAAAWGDMKSRLARSSDLGSPLWLLSEDTTAEQQLDYTKRWVEKNYRSAAHEPRQRARPTSDRVRIGYFSGDFHQHPVPCLMVEVLELHDRNRFEVFAYSYGPDDRSAMRARLTDAVEHFVDVAWEPDDIVVQRIRADEPDILIDLKGYTAGDRLRVMAQRPCDLQISWLGYPGTTGAPFIDYLIADAFVIPSGAEHLYSERVLRLPHCYQPNDRKRAALEPRSRAEYGIPENAFVFCCFGQTAKYSRELFQRWMSLLRAVPESVLWLLEDNPWATRNLLEATATAGVDPVRVVVAPRLPPSEHLARYAVADVALDTFPYTSHTTGSDALWQGCPLVALCGETFASRVSGSLITNCRVPELMTHSFQDYENLALRLARDAEFMRAVRTQLAAACDAAALFDSTQFARDLEALYVSLLQ